MFNTNFFITLINFLLKYFSKKVKKITLLDHNGIKIENYPESEWYLSPFPKQKGLPFNSDNLTTVNRYKFLENEKFKESLKVSEKRWCINGNEKTRDISWRLHVMLWSVSLALSDIDSENDIFIECGTGKGYMAAGICNFFNWGKSKPIMYLIDSFKSTMPEKDGSQIVDGKKLFVYSDGDEEVRHYFKKYDNIKILTGLIPDILKLLPDKKTIKFLHLDLNSAIAEFSALVYFKSKFKKGSIILFDDYGGYGAEDQAEIHEKFAVELNSNLLILPTGQALLIL